MVRIKTPLPAAKVAVMGLALLRMVNERSNTRATPGCARALSMCWERAALGGEKASAVVHVFHRKTGKHLAVIWHPSQPVGHASDEV
eukprot:12066-Heterococcus_DN1.PRE.1